MKLWRVAPFFSLTFGEVCYLKREEKRSCLFSFQITNLTKSEWKKGATRQSFIRKEITTYRIGTLIAKRIVSPIFTLLELETSQTDCQKNCLSYFYAFGTWKLSLALVQVLRSSFVFKYCVQVLAGLSSYPFKSIVKRIVFLFLHFLNLKTDFGWSNLLFQTN